MIGQSQHLFSRMVITFQFRLGHVPQHLHNLVHTGWERHHHALIDFLYLERYILQVALSRMAVATTCIYSKHGLFQWDRTIRTFLETLGYELLSVSVATNVVLMPNIWMWPYVRWASGWLVSLSLKSWGSLCTWPSGWAQWGQRHWKWRLTCSSPLHTCWKYPWTSPQTPDFIATQNWKGPWQCSSGIFPSLPLRGFSLLQDTSKGHSSRKKGVWGGAEQVGSCQLSSSFTQSNNSFNSCKQPGASFHFVWKGGSNVKKRFECTWSTCSLHLADERIEVQRSNLYWAC